MINHARTLFINDRWRQSTEYVDPTFRTVTLPDDLLQVHRLLLPDGISADTLNALVDSYTVSLHQGEFEPGMLEFDDRITYKLDTLKMIPPQEFVSYQSSPEFFVAKIPRYIFKKRPDYRDVFYGRSTFYSRFCTAFLAMIAYINSIRGNDA